MAEQESLTLRKGGTLLGWAILLGLLAAAFLGVGNYSFGVGAVLLAGLCFGGYYLRPDLRLDLDRRTLETPGESVSLDDVRGLILEPDFHSQEPDDVSLFSNLTGGRLLGLARQYSDSREIDETVGVTVVVGPADGAFDAIASAAENDTSGRTSTMIHGRLEDASLETPIQLETTEQTGLLVAIARSAAARSGAPLVDLTGTEAIVHRPEG